MDEQMIEQIARAIAREDMLADGYSDNAANNYAASDAWKHFAPAARAAHSVMAGKVAELVDVLRRVEPHLDAIICYASTMGEHEPNRIARDVRAALAPYPERRSEP